jgi:ABC-type phosphate transport system substrate-binding protein
MAVATRINGGSDIVVHSNNPDKIILIDRHTIQLIFTGHKTRWSNGEPVVPFIKHPQSIEHQDFVRNVLNMTPFRYAEMLDNAKLMGNPVPKIVASDDAMALKVAQTKGGIGYINYAIILNDKTLTVIDGSAIK